MMISITSILCPVDHSRESRHALRCALRLAVEHDARVTVLTVVDPLVSSTAVTGFDAATALAAARQELTAFVEATPRLSGTSPVPQLHAEAGEPSATILKMSAQFECDLIVMGTHGSSGYKQLFFGSVARKVLRKTRIPVIVVPPIDREAADKTPAPVILAPVDVSAPLAIEQAAVAAALARDSRRPLLLLHVVPNDDSRSIVDGRMRTAALALEGLRSYVIQPAEVDTCVVRGEPGEQIAKLAAARRVALVVMGLEDRSGLRDHTGSVAYRVLATTRVPVLALPAASLMTPALVAQG